MKQKLFCFGLGYTARHLVTHLQNRTPGIMVAGTGRHQPPTPLPDVAWHSFDGTRPQDETLDKEADTMLTDATHLLLSIPPQVDHGDPVLYHHAAQIRALKNLRWIGYLSTTGVYGDHQGGWVDENSSPAPTTPRGHLRWTAEQAWTRLCAETGLPLHIFRLGSIYGPGRGQLAAILQGRAQKIIKDGQYFSRIHVTDIVRALTASMATPAPGRVYNLVDDLPAPSPAVLDYVCGLLGRPPLPEIPFAEAALSPMMKSFYAENKRVSNRRMKQELGFELSYPTYREGFRALLKD